MNRVVLMMVTVVLIAASAQAKNYVYGESGMTMESEGYKLFASDRIAGTVDKLDKDAGDITGYCKGVDEKTSGNLGDVNSIRSDNRIPLGNSAKISYSNACSTFYAVVARLKTSDDIRRLWLLFADSATDDYAVKTLKEHGPSEDASVLIEMKRMEVVAKYVEFFTKNKDWRLTDYTFLSQAFKARKGKALSPAFSRFVAALLTGDTERALQVVKSIDLANLGIRLVAPPTGE